MFLDIPIKQKMRTSVLVCLQFVSFFAFFDSIAQKVPDQSIVRIKGYGNGLEIGAGIVAGFDKDDKEIFLITALHVVEAADSITVEFRQHKKEFPAAIFKVKQELDLAVLRVPLQEIALDFKSQVVAESSDYRISLVKIIGHPQGSSWVLSSNKFLMALNANNFTVSHEGIGKGYSGGGVFSNNDRLMGMMVENRSHDALVLDLLAIIEFLDESKIETNLWVKPKMNYTTAGVMGAGAAGILVSLFVFENKSKDLYTTYEDHRFSNDPIYTEMGMTRDEVYDQANSKHNAAVITGVVGGVVLAAGSYMLIRKLNKRKKEKRHDGLVVVPHFNMPDYALSSGNAVTLGVTIRF